MSFSQRLQREWLAGGPLVQLLQPLRVGDSSGPTAGVAWGLALCVACCPDGRLLRLLRRRWRLLLLLLLWRQRRLLHLP